ncbi:hypothetical protein O9929_26535 [Vibrio lentus]|nr:hypothetical protein [Vibrio lentus]
MKQGRTRKVIVLISRLDNHFIGAKPNRVPNLILMITLLKSINERNQSYLIYNLEALRDKRLRGKFTSYGYEMFNSKLSYARSDTKKQRHRRRFVAGA